jgi:uncharacterized membrane protein
LILGGIIFVSCLLIIRPPKSKTAGEKFSPKGVAVILLMSIYIALLEKVGFFILTPLFLFALPVLAGFRRYGVVMASVLVVTAALYGIFIEVLNIPLPAGLLGD